MEIPVDVYNTHLEMVPAMPWDAHLKVKKILYCTCTVHTKFTV